MQGHGSLSRDSHKGDGRAVAKAKSQSLGEFSCPPIHGLRGQVCAKLTVNGRCPPPLSTLLSSVTWSVHCPKVRLQLSNQAVVSRAWVPISFVSSPRPHACRPVRFSPSSYSQVLARLTFSPLPLSLSLSLSFDKLALYTSEKACIFNSSRKRKASRSIAPLIVFASQCALIY